MLLQDVIPYDVIGMMTCKQAKLERKIPDSNSRNNGSNVPHQYFDSRNSQLCLLFYHCLQLTMASEIPIGGPVLDIEGNGRTTSVCAGDNNCADAHTTERMVSILPHYLV